MPRLSVNYSNTVMYKIVCNDLNITDFYVGSTTDFIRRKSMHKFNCNKNDCKYKIYDIIRKNGGWDNWTMLEIEKYPCSDGNEATLRERYWYELLKPTLNMIYPCRTPEEYYKDNAVKYHEYYEKNKDKILENRKIYIENNNPKVKEQQHKYAVNNKDAILENKKEYYKNNRDKILQSKQIYGKKEIICSCGVTIKQSSRFGHLKTKTHLENLEKLKNNI